MYNTEKENLALERFFIEMDSKAVMGINEKLYMISKESSFYHCSLVIYYSSKNSCIIEIVANVHWHKIFFREVVPIETVLLILQLFNDMPIEVDDDISVTHKHITYMLQGDISSAIYRIPSIRLTIPGINVKIDKEGFTTKNTIPVTIFYPEGIEHKNKGFFKNHYDCTVILREYFSLLDIYLKELEGLNISYIFNGVLLYIQKEFDAGVYSNTFTVGKLKYMDRVIILRGIAILKLYIPSVQRIRASIERNIVSNYNRRYNLCSGLRIKNTNDIDGYMDRLQDLIQLHLHSCIPVAEFQEGMAACKDIVSFIPSLAIIFEEVALLTNVDNTLAVPAQYFIDLLHNSYTEYLLK